MMFVLYPLALAAALAAVALFVWGALPEQVRTVSVERLQGRAADARPLPSLWLKLLYPVLSGLAPFFQAVPWPGFRERMPVELDRAGVGDHLTPNHVLAMKALFAIVIPLVAAQIIELLGNPAMMVLVAVASFFLPDKLIADMRKAREAEIVRALPNAVDVISLSVEAGLEFLTAMQRVVERGGIGALRDELATILNDIRLGKSRADALKAFAARIERPEIGSFVSVLVQADLLGASIGPVLQQQAERMRIERFQRAEKEGGRATQKILFPLVLFIFPSVLIVIMGPVILQFIYGN
jgi:tight adherence protein C